MLLIIDLYVRYGRFMSQLRTVTHNPLYDILRRRHRTREWPSLFCFFSSSHIFESAHISHHNMFLYCRDSSEEDCTDKTECQQLVYEQVHFHFSLLSELKSLSLSFSLSLMISLCCDRLFLLLCSKTRTVQILVATYIHVSLLSMQIWLICRYDQVTIRTNFTFRPVPIYFQNIP